MWPAGGMPCGWNLGERSPRKPLSREVPKYQTFFIIDSTAAHPVSGPDAGGVQKGEGIGAASTSWGSSAQCAGLRGDDEGGGGAEDMAVAASTRVSVSALSLGLWVPASITYLPLN